MDGSRSTHLRWHPSSTGGSEKPAGQGPASSGSRPRRRWARLDREKLVSSSPQVKFKLNGALTGIGLFSCRHDDVLVFFPVKMNIKMAHSKDHCRVAELVVYSEEYDFFLPVRRGRKSR